MKRIVLAVLACVALLALPLRGRAAGMLPRLDPRLASALVPAAEPVAVWVEFMDKGEQGPADLAARLAQAERDLPPGSRARRIRTGVTPLVAKEISEKIAAPTIGIGSGPDCDGQILVTQDLTGSFPWFTPRFVKPKANCAAEVKAAVTAWKKEIGAP